MLDAGCLRLWFQLGVWLRSGESGGKIKTSRCIKIRNLQILGLEFCSIVLVQNEVSFVGSGGHFGEAQEIEVRVHPPSSQDVGMDKAIM